MRLATTVIILSGTAALGVVHFVEGLAIRQGAPPGPFALGQTAVALMVLWPIWLWKRRQDGLTLLRCGRLGSLALIGTLASGIVVLLSIMALSYTSATHKGVIQATYPLGTLFFAWILLRERIPVIGYVAAATVVTGLVLMTSRGLSASPNPGDWILIATVPLMGFSDAYSKKVLNDVPPITVGLGRYLFGTLFLILLLSVLDLGSLVELLPVWPLLLTAGVLSALAMGLFYWTIKRIGPSIAAGLLAAAPLVTATLEWWWLDERFLRIQLLGIALVLLGVAALSRQRRVIEKSTDATVRTTSSAR